MMKELLRLLASTKGNNVVLTALINMPPQLPMIRMFVYMGVGVSIKSYLDVFIKHFPLTPYEFHTFQDQ